MYEMTYDCQCIAPHPCRCLPSGLECIGSRQPGHQLPLVQGTAQLTAFIPNAAIFLISEYIGISFLCPGQEGPKGNKMSTDRHDDDEQLRSTSTSFESSSRTLLETWQDAFKIEAWSLFDQSRLSVLDRATTSDQCRNELADEAV